MKIKTKSINASPEITIRHKFINALNGFLVNNGVSTDSGAYFNIKTSYGDTYELVASHSNPDYTRSIALLMMATSHPSSNMYFSFRHDKKLVTILELTCHYNNLEAAIDFINNVSIDLDIVYKDK